MEPPVLAAPEIPPLKRRRLPPWTMQAFGYVLSAGCLWWALRGVSLRQMWQDLLTLSWGYVILAMAVDLSVYVIHGWRWNILLGPIAKLSLWRSVQAIYIGLFANEVLPLRTGELIRCYLLAHWNDLHLSLVFASAAVERVFDGYWMIATFLVTSAFLKLPSYLNDVVRFLAVLLVFAGIALVFIAKHRHHVHGFVRKSRWAVTLRHVVDGLHTMGNRRTMVRAAGASFVYMVVQIVPVWALLKAYEMDLSIWAAAAILMVIRFGTVIPNAPGNAGLYQAACIVALGLFGVDKTTAAGFSFVMFFALTLPLLAGGAVAVALTGLNLHEIRHHAKRGFAAVQEDEE